MTSMTHRATENDACTGIGYFNDNISIIHFTNMESSINQELMAQPQTKRCPRCGRTLTVEHFSRHGKSKDGLQTYCKECHRAMCAKTNDKRIGGIYPPQSRETRTRRSAISHPASCLRNCNAVDFTENFSTPTTSKSKVVW